MLKTGKGTIKVAPVMSIDKNGTITIISLPGSKNIETVQKIIEPEYLSEKVDIRDESTDKIHIVIEKVPRKQCNMQELYERLYKNYNRQIIIIWHFLMRKKFMCLVLLIKLFEQIYSM